jgi:hypothetical protein
MATKMGLDWNEAYLKKKPKQESKAIKSHYKGLIDLLKQSIVLSDESSKLVQMLESDFGRQKIIAAEKSEPIHQPTAGEPSDASQLSSPAPELFKLRNQSNQSGPTIGTGERTSAPATHPASAGSVFQDGAIILVDGLLHLNKDDDFVSLNVKPGSGGLILRHRTSKNTFWFRQADSNASEFADVRLSVFLFVFPSGTFVKLIIYHLAILSGSRRVELRLQCSRLEPFMP